MRMGPDPFPARHDLVWLREAWRRSARGPVAPRDLEALEEWFARGLPAVACRRSAPCGDALALGIALPPRCEGEKRRVAILLDPAAVARVARPATLRDAVQGAPVSWRERLLALDRAARAAGVLLRVYGSLAWQHLTGLSYVTAGSDVDLLAEPRTGAELRRVLELLRASDAGAAPRLDGEVVLTGGRAVAWRELVAGGARVLVKSGASVVLEPRRALLGSEEPWR
jgi:phosphoribosyl-dephospho-CoA transferase